jgi:hypothetical protein
MLDAFDILFANIVVNFARLLLSWSSDSHMLKDTLFLEIEVAESFGIVPNLIIPERMRNLHQIIWFK